MEVGLAALVVGVALGPVVTGLGSWWGLVGLQQQQQSLYMYSKQYMRQNTGCRALLAAACGACGTSVHAGPGIGWR